MKKVIFSVAITMALLALACKDGTRRDYDDEGHNEGVLQEHKDSAATRYDNPGKVNDTTEAARDRD
jgi:hypothetical protein